MRAHLALLYHHLLGIEAEEGHALRQHAEVVGGELRKQARHRLHVAEHALRGTGFERATVRSRLQRDGCRGTLGIYMKP